MRERRGFRTFLVLWLTQSLSVWGNSIRFFTITFWITGVLYAADRGRAAFALAAVSIAVSITSVLIAPVAGSWVDRLDRRRLMLACDLASGALSLALGALMLTQRLTLPVLLPWVVVFTVLRAAHHDAFSASYAMLLDPKELPRGNAMMQTSSSLAGIVAPGLAALLISLPAARMLPSFGGLVATGAPFALLADALTFLVAGGALGFLDIPSPTGMRAARVRIGGHFREGLRFLRGRPALLWLLVLMAVTNLLVPGAFVLQPLVVRFQLAGSWRALGLTYATALALVTSSLSLGSVVGGVVVSATGGLRSRRTAGIVLGLVVEGAALAVFGLSPQIYVSAASTLAIGLASPFVTAHSQALWQTATPKELQGRVFAVRRAASQALSPIGIALGGALSAALAAGPVVAGMGCLLALFAGSQLLNRRLMRAAT